MGAEQELSGDTALLYELTAALNRIDDPERSYALALDATIRGAIGDRAAILLFDNAGVMRFAASRGLSDAYRAAVEGHTPWRRETRDPAPVVVSDVDADPGWSAYRDVFRAERIRALAFVPIVERGALLGKLMVYRDEPRPFRDRDIQLATTVAHHVAHTVERVRAKLAAEQATRAREEILSVVSHDLRNPLTAVMLGATTLMDLEGDDPEIERARGTATRIHRQAQRMARLIDDLVDFAGIQAGRLALQPARHTPGEIVAAALEAFAPIATERGVALRSSVVQGLPSVSCDSERILQVLGNLLSNAVKVSPRGGMIEVGVKPRPGEVVFSVHDEGPGIAADELPLLFERFWRSKTSAYKGAGLGLSIARGIVDAHGGRIWAESGGDKGATFFVGLTTAS